MLTNNFSLICLRLIIQNIKICENTIAHNKKNIYLIKLRLDN